MYFSINTPCAMLKNVYLGIRVITCELGWLLGEDRAFHNQIARLEKQHHMLQCRLSEMAVLAAPERLELEADLALLHSDMAALIHERALHHREHLRPVTLLF